MSLLLGIDEGTSAVKAVLYDTELHQVAEARREKALQHPRPGWVEQDAEEVLAAARKYIDIKRSVTGILLPVPGSTGAEIVQPALPATVVQ